MVIDYLPLIKVKTTFTMSPLAAYAIAVRGSEYDLPQDILDNIVAKSISAFGTSAYESRGSSGHQRDDADDYDI